MYYNLPEELRLLPQFVLWRFETVEGSDKPTKVPYNPKNGYRASPTNPETWGTFEQCVSILPNVPMNGIGFVLSKNDPYSCIDLDPTDNEEERNRQIAIYKAFPSYSEISPSGKGLHIWVKGKVLSNCNRKKVEIYSHGHYMTVTGNVHVNDCIKEHNDLLNQLWAEMTKQDENYNYDSRSKNQIQSDSEIIKAASEAVNGQKFIDLFEGRWQEYYNDDASKVSCNEADYALVDIIAYYTQNHEQIARIFRMSKLARRSKAQRNDYLFNSKYGIVIKALDRQLPSVDLDELKNQIQKQIAEKEIKEQQLSETVNVVEPVIKAQPVQPVVDAHTKEIESQDQIKDKKIKQVNNFNSLICDVPPGLLGEIARFIYQAAPRPVPEIALAGAIGLMSGIIGRCYNVSGTGLNQYILLLAITGAGKEAISTGIDKLICECKKTVPACNEFIGPGEIASPQALIKYMNKTSSSFVSLAGEFGLLLKQICSPRANPNQIGLRRVMLDLFNKSGEGKSYKSIIYSDKDKNTGEVYNPAFSLIGESTPERFFETLTDDMIYEGLLPRFTIIEYRGNRPKLNENHLKAVPSQQLVEQFSQLCAYALQLNNGNQVIKVNMDKVAFELFTQFNTHCDNSINDAHNEITRHLWNRAHIKSLKLAALIAVGCNFYTPCINEYIANWAINLITHDVTNVLARYDAGEIGMPTAQNQQVEEVYKAIRKYIYSTWEDVESFPGSSYGTWYHKVIPHSFITAFCRLRICFKNDRLGPMQALKTVLNSMIESGDIQEISPGDKASKKLPRNGKIYAVTGVKIV